MFFFLFYCFCFLFWLIADTRGRGRAAGPSLASPSIESPASSARTFETKRELELKRRMEMLQREMAAHHIHHLHHRGPDTFSGSDISGGSGESRVSVGAVQALQEEIAALRGVLSGMAAHVGHTQPAICESEILPEYEETRWCECCVSPLLGLDADGRVLL